ncbi:2Fe-2S iron-sulfur cluster-binding protein [Flavobacterium branchiophilum]|uniref:Phenylacetic acid degradation protein n=1 Tax=Flavobacterium branchiophilum TaxID=55197 RepID=A0A2H3KGF6_9FLAO|nr:2Fe-2S iron-sulfur cluster-binding protein [Flavobacterium branchiophilum]PDS26824.1 phenylacetic acid degradation protein [Flavobacterium branchiophilum]
MSKFYPLKVSHLFKETADCTVITFEIPIEFQSIFAYKQGQYLTLKATINHTEIRRSYSLSSSPLENLWQVAVKKVPHGVFSSYINDQLQVGDVIEVMPPNGHFNVPIESQKTKNYIAFAAGSGITPIISIIKTHLKAEPNCTFKLFYLNKNVHSIIFKETIEQLKNCYLERFEIFYFLTNEYRPTEWLNGRFSEEKIAFITEKVIDVSFTDDCFICGPQDMIFLIQHQLIAAGLSKDTIHFELFNTQITAQDQKRIEQIMEQKSENTEVTIIDGGKEFHFIMNGEDDTILDGALAAGADLPFACKGGVCSTCRCKIVAGTAQMKLNYSLEPFEIANQIILSCQAVPTSKKIVVDFGI